MAVTTDAILPGRCAHSQMPLCCERADGITMASGRSHARGVNDVHRLEIAHGAPRAMVCQARGNDIQARVARELGCRGGEHALERWTWKILAARAHDVCGVGLEIPPRPSQVFGHDRLHRQSLRGQD